VVEAAPGLDPVDERRTRLEDEVHARVGEDLLDVGRAALQVPGDDPVLLDEGQEVGRRRAAVEDELPRRGVGLEDPAGVLGDLGHGVGFFQDAGFRVA
jgi:hypothetical protein